MQQEPVLVAALIHAALVLLVAFGVPLSPELRAALLGIGGPLATLIAAILVRRKVTPV